MPEPAAFAGRRLVRIAVCLLLGTGVFVAYGALGAFFLLALVGGVLSAGVMVILGRRGHAVPLSVPDRFRGSMTADVINVSRVRVAGVGGLGMTIMALAIAYFIPQIGVSVALGLVGGVMGGAALIVYRRRHGPLHDDRGQIGGRSVLVARP